MSWLRPALALALALTALPLSAQRPAPDAGAAREPEPEPEPEAEPEPEPGAETETETEVETEAEPEAEPEREAEAGAETETEAGAETEPEAGTEIEAEPLELELSAEELSELTAEAEAEAAEEGDSSELVLEQLSILGSAEQIPRIGGSATVIGEEELERMERDDIHRVLEAAPGVYVRGEDGFGLRPNIGIRGASSERSAKVTLMEDGILLGPAPYSAPAAYYFPLVTRMTAVEVFKGPASIRYGPQTIGGALNMVTRPVPEAPTGELDLAAGQYRTGKVHGYYGQHVGPFGVLLEGVHLQSEGFKEIDGGGPTGFDKNEAMVKLRYRSAPEARVFHRVELKLGYADEVSHETYLGLSRADFEDDSLRRYAASQDDVMDWWRTQAEATYLLAVGQDLTLRAVAYRHDFDRVWDRLNRFQGGPALEAILASPDQGVNAVFFDVLTGAQGSMTPDETLLLIANDRRFVSQGVQLTGNWVGTTGPVRHDLSLGARLHFDGIERDHEESGFRMLSRELVPDGIERDPVTLNEASTRATALHFQDELGLGKLHLTPGLRVELIDTHFEDRIADSEQDRFDTVVIPGLGAHYQLLPELGVLAGVHKGFSPVAPGQPDTVEPEDSTNYEAGARYAGDRARAELIGFFNDYDNLVAVCTFSSGCGQDELDMQFNSGRVFVYGLEATSGVEVPATPDLALGLDLNYTLTLTRFDSDFVSGFPLYGDVEGGDELPYVSRHSLTALGRAETRHAALSLSVRYSSAMRAEAGQGDFEGREGAEEHLVLDLSASLAPTERDQIYLNIQNLLDNRHIASMRPFAARPGKPLQILLGYKHRFGAAQ